MRILFLTPQLPYPPHQGTAMRNYGLIRGLAEQHQVSLLSFLEPNQSLDAAGPLLTLCQGLETVPAPPPRRLARRALDTFTRRLPDMGLRLASPTFANRLAAWLARESFDTSKGSRWRLISTCCCPLPALLGSAPWPGPWLPVVVQVRSFPW
jgi:hypothetical protein